MTELNCVWLHGVTPTGMHPIASYLTKKSVATKIESVTPQVVLDASAPAGPNTAPPMVTGPAGPCTAAIVVPPCHNWSLHLTWTSYPQYCYGSRFQHSRAFIACSISTRPRHCLWLLCYVAIQLYVLNYLAGPANNCMQHMLTITFTLKFPEYLYLSTPLYRLEFECQSHS